MHILKIIESAKPNTVILACSCGHRVFADAHGKACCGSCGAVATVDAPAGTPRAAVKDEPAAVVERPARRVRK